MGETAEAKATVEMLEVAMAGVGVRGAEAGRPVAAAKTAGRGVARGGGGTVSDSTRSGHRSGLGCSFRTPGYPRSPGRTCGC